MVFRGNGCELKNGREIEQSMHPHERHTNGHEYFLL